MATQQDTTSPEYIASIVSKVLANVQVKPQKEQEEMTQQQIEDIEDVEDTSIAHQTYSDEPKKGYKLCPTCEFYIPARAKPCTHSEPMEIEDPNELYEEQETSGKTTQRQSKSVFNEEKNATVEATETKRKVHHKRLPRKDTILETGMMVVDLLCYMNAKDYVREIQSYCDEVLSQ
jgi:hypothetical protein